MTESFGGQTIVLTTVTTSGQPGYLGIMTEVRTDTTVTGCHGRVLSTAEIDAQTDTSTEVWKWTVPPVAAAINAKPNGELTYGGRVFQIDGPVMPKTDGATVHHVTILAKRQVS
jgi:hypothetical protein